MALLFAYASFVRLDLGASLRGLASLRTRSLPRRVRDVPLIDGAALSRDVGGIPDDGPSAPFCGWKGLDRNRTGLSRPSSRRRHRRHRLQPLDSSRGALARFPAWTCETRTEDRRTGEGTPTKRPETCGVVSTSSWCRSGSFRPQWPANLLRTITCLITREACAPFRLLSTVLRVSERRLPSG